MIGAYQQIRVHKTWCLCSSTIMKRQNIIPEGSDIEKHGEQKSVFIFLGSATNATTKGSAISQDPHPPVVTDQMFHHAVNELKHCFYDFVTN